MSVDFEELQENGQVNLMEWYQTASEEEKRLADNVARLERLFDDMRFRPGTVADTLIVTSYINPDTNEKFEDFYDVPDFFDNLSVDLYFTFKVEEGADETAGTTYTDDRIVRISPDRIDDEIVLLHEMTHVYDYLYTTINGRYRDSIFWCLYRYLSKRISNFDELIDLAGNFAFQDHLQYSGGNHSLLFIMKTLELDIRKGFQLGTVMQYDFCDYLEDYSYTPDPSDT